MKSTKQTVLITGGAGYIGTHCIIELMKAGYNVVIVDNLTNSSQVALSRVEKILNLTSHLPFYNVDLLDKEKLLNVFKEHSFYAVLHLAGLKAVGESVEKPLLYYKNNICGTINLLECMKETNVQRILFSSSATVYGSPQHLPINENHPIGQGISNPYGQTKFMIEQILFDLYRAEPNWSIVILRYFNPVGAHESGLIGECPIGVPANLMPFVAQVAIGLRPEVNVFGNDYDTADGTGVRDYIHVVDLARGHVAGMRKLNEGPGVKVYNLGTGTGHSVLEMIETFKDVSKRKIDYVIKPRREGDLATVICDPCLASKELGWKAQYNLHDMCESLWNWQSKNPRGYDE